MFRWYAKSHVCFVYLSDVSVDQEPKQVYLVDFMSSRWLKRGWTLQEMLAPERVEFYDVDWNMFGTKLSLRDEISSITGIRKEVLTSRFDVEASKSKHCVAEKMSWASGRKTTRVEDLAYCLLGIFDINMPLLYGEGERAFERLQFQILAETEDLTLFAWKRSFPQPWDLNPELPNVDGLLAKSPFDFYDAGTYESLMPRPDSTIQRLKDEPPTKRLGFFNLSVPVVPVSEELPELLVLASYQAAGEGPPDTCIWTTTKQAEYLCLPLVSIKELGYSSAYVKNGPPFRTALGDRESGVRLKRISIRLNSNSLVSRYPGATKPLTALIAFYQSQWTSPKLFYWDDVENQSYAILFRHGSSPSFEFLVLCGWYTNAMPADRKTPWAVITDWKELSTVLELVPGAEDRGKAGDFPRRETLNGGYILCSIKARTREWCLPLQNKMTKSKFHDLVNPVREVYSLDVQVKSAEGHAEKIEYVSSRQWADFAPFRNFIRSGSDGRAGFSRGPRRM